MYMYKYKYKYIIVNSGGGGTLRRYFLVLVVGGGAQKKPILKDFFFQKSFVRLGVFLSFLFQKFFSLMVVVVGRNSNSGGGLNGVE